MQEENRQTNSWQQPDIQNGGAPYQAPMTLNDTPESYDMAPPDAELTQTELPDEQGSEDAALLRWQATEYVDHDRKPSWYITLAIISLVLIAVAFLLMKSWTFALLVPVMAVALIVYTRRPPTVNDYTLSRKGLYVNERLYPYDTFRAFSIISHAGHHTANLIPRKRFQMTQTVYFPEEVGEPLVDMLAARMPMQDAKPDIFDRITTRLRM